MRVVHLSLTDFRNYRQAELPLLPGPNLIIGRNGQGKTNLVEAISYFATLRSHRVSTETALIRAHAGAAVARMRVEAVGREALLEVQLNRDSPNRAQLNRAGTRVRELTRWFSSVFFAPEDLSIARGDPSGRRRFLDEALVARNPLMAGVVADYERVVKQRTALLKSAKASGARSAVDSTLAVWDEQLVELGTQIMIARRQLVAELSVPLQDAYAALVEQDHSPALSLSESVDGAFGSSRVSRETFGSSRDGDVSRETLQGGFHAALREVRSREIERAVTLIGPHRDDLILELNGLPVKGYASHGETWSFVLSLKVALANLLREQATTGDPVIILDDVFAELDTKRRNRLMASVGDFEQVIVTAAVEDDVPSELAWHRVEVDDGTIKRVGDNRQGGALGAELRTDKHVSGT
ncbi:MAG: DNA replication/repair protein RecF [Leucobacter sp.]